MRKNQAILAVAVIAVVLALVASYIASNNGGDEPEKPSIVDEWELVTVYGGGWLEGYPLYSEYAVYGEKATISHYKGDFYIFDMDGEKSYCSWDGEKMVTAGLHDSTSVVFIMQLPENENYLIASYFAGTEAVIELYQRAGFVGPFPGLSIPIDLPEMGTSMETYKVREYTPEGPIDHVRNTMTLVSVEGRMLFYDMGYSAQGVYYYIGIYLTSGSFMSLVVSADGPEYEMTEYRGGVFYCSMMDYGTGNIWVAEFGDPASADYPDKNLANSTFEGTEDAVVFKDGRIIEEINSNEIGLDILMQDGACLIISTLDQSGNEDASWTSMVNDLRPVHHYGLSIQSAIEYKGVMYHGCYFGHFDSKQCKELYIYGVLSGEDGSCIVISQKYTNGDTGQLQLQ